MWLTCNLYSQIFCIFWHIPAYNSKSANGVFPDVSFLSGITVTVWPIRVAAVEAEKRAECTKYGYMVQMLTTTAITRLWGNGKPSWGGVGGEARHITGVPKDSNMQRRERGDARVERGRLNVETYPLYIHIRAHFNP
jgi:hypothetical protein